MVVLVLESEHGSGLIDSVRHLLNLADLVPGRESRFSDLVLYPVGPAFELVVRDLLGVEPAPENSVSEVGEFW